MAASLARQDGLTDYYFGIRESLDNRCDKWKGKRQKNKWPNKYKQPNLVSHYYTINKHKGNIASLVRNKASGAYTSDTLSSLGASGRIS